MTYNSTLNSIDFYFNWYIMVIDNGN
jgi:hypothetical protein